MYDQLPSSKGDSEGRCVDYPDGGLYRPFRCAVQNVTELTPTEKLFRLTRLDGEPFGHRPGQFMQVSIIGLGEAPISVSSSPTRGEFLDLGVRNVGRLTSAMHRLKPGDEVGLRGPFGTYFDTQAMKGRDLLLVAGGCGLAPMRALIQFVEDTREEYGQATILYGAQSPTEILYKNEVTGWRESSQFVCQITVDNVTDGTCWDNHVGLITGLIPPLKLDPDNTVAVIVGPPVMYEHVIEELHAKGLRNRDIIVSLERYMKCGVGKCGHCAIDHLYCCIDGPVFSLDQVDGLKNAL